MLLNKYYANNVDKNKNSSINDTKSSQEIVSKNFNSSVTSKTKELTDIKSAADELFKASTTLYTKGSDSVFNDDKDSVLDAVKKFVSKFNNTVEVATKAEDQRIESTYDDMVLQIEAYSEELSEIGISMDENDKLVISEEQLSKSTVDSIKNIFQGTTSVAYKIALLSSNLGANAVNASVGVGYNNQGAYQSMSMASSFDAYL